MAHIPLKENATPQRAKAFTMHGDHRGAYAKVTQDGLDKGFIEPPPTGKSEWIVQGFVVPKKSADFP